MKRIIVMGGSFNPPTVAHQKLLLSAVDSLRADMGIYVPSSHEYVKKKMDKAGHPSEVLSEKLRLRMLCEMAADDSRLNVDDYEFHLTEKSRTYNTMVYLQKKYPDAELFFLAGGDKLDIFPRWYRIKDFLEQFLIIVTNRENYDAREAISENPFLNSYRDRFAVIDYPDGIDGISSSSVREKWRQGDIDAVRGMLHPSVYDMMQEPTKYVINKFRDGNWFLSNFYPSPVTYNGLTYQNAEAAFQAQKCMTDEERLEFTELDPAKAKSKGRCVALRGDWEDVKLSIMEEIVYAKFRDNDCLKELLLSTGDAELIEGNTWNDVFWGVSLNTGKGENNLGKILMSVREKLRRVTF